MSYTPFLEWRLAAQWANYTWEQFEALEGDQQAGVVASYRAFNQIEAVLAKVENDRMRARNKTAGK